MKKIFLLLLVLSLTACSTTQKVPPQPGYSEPKIETIQPKLDQDTNICENSLIFNKIKNPTSYITMLNLATSIVVLKYPNTKQYLFNTFKKLDFILKDNRVTYLEVTNLLKDNIKWISNYFNDHTLVGFASNFFLDKPIPINQCDLELFHKLVDSEINILK